MFKKVAPFMAMILILGSLYDEPKGKVIYTFPKQIIVSLLAKDGDWIKIRIQFGGVLFIPALDITGWLNLKLDE